MRRKHVLSVLMLSMGVALLILATTVGVASSATQKSSSAKALRGGVLKVAHSGDGFDTLDPQLAYVANDWGLLYNTQLLLVNFPNKPGKAGLVLQPEAASSFPTISKDGKTYVFHLRKGQRFSDGSPVTAAAFQRAFERVLSPKQYAQYGCFDAIDQKIVGGKQFANCAGAKVKTTSHISGITAKGLTLTIHLVKADPTFISILAMQWFGAVKPNMKYTTDPNGILVYPSAGPYYISADQPQRLAVLKRNPYYHGFRESNPNQIVIQENAGSGEPQVLQIEKNQIDLDFGGVPSTQVAAVAQKYGVNKSQFHVGTTSCIDWLELNNARAPTNDLKVREALNYAIGRSPIIRLGGPYSGVAADQLLTPPIPGYHKLNIYPNFPNFAKAKAVGAGHLSGTLNLYYRPSSRFQSSLVQFEQAQFSRIGFQTNLQQSDPTGFYRPLETKSIATGPDGYNVAWGGWCADYFDPFDYFNVNLDGRTIGATGNVDYFYFNNSKFNAAMDKAAALSGPARYAAYAALDKDLMTKYIPFIPYEVSNNRFLTSSRVKNFIYHDYFDYPILGALSVG
jgi:peptide/nickel transport system substrate-binding protein